MNEPSLEIEKALEFSFYRKLLFYFSKVLEFELPCDFASMAFYLEENKLRYLPLKENSEIRTVSDIKKIVQSLHEKGICGILISAKNSEIEGFQVQINATQLSHVENSIDYLELFEKDYQHLQEIILPANTGTQEQLQFFTAPAFSGEELHCLNCGDSYPKDTTLCFSCGFSLLNPGGSDSHYEVVTTSELSQEAQMEFIQNYIDLGVDLRRPIKLGQLVVIGVSEKIGQVLIRKAAEYGVPLKLKESSSFSDFKSPLVKFSKLKDMALHTFDRISWYKKSVPFFRVEAPKVMSRIKGDFFRSIWHREEAKVTTSLALVDTFFHEYMRWVQIYQEFLSFSSKDSLNANSISFNHLMNHFTEIYLKLVAFRNLITSDYQIEESRLFTELKQIYESIESYEASQKVVNKN